MPKTILDKDNPRGQALKMVGKTIVYAFAVFGLIFIIILLGVLGIMSPSSKLSAIPDKSILTIDFDQNYTEVRSDDFIAEFTDKSSYSFFDLVRAINAAADDDRIKAISATIGTTPLGLAQIEEIGQSIDHFQSKGKTAYIFSNGMGSFGQGSKEYLLSSYFKEIWLQPNSDVGLTGLSIEVPFFKKLFKKIGIEPEFYTRYEYKTAVNSLIDADFTPQFRQEMESLGKGLYLTLITCIMKNRHLSGVKIEDSINQAPLFAEEAVAAGLADEVGYRQDLRQKLKKLYNAKIYDINDYMAHIIDYQGSQLPEIAVMVLEGVIENGKSTNNPLNDAVIGSETVLSQLDELAAHKNLKALILRINSPGGSYTASDEIWAALESFKKENNIPIIVSMSNYAASGGYFIALAGDYIIAENSTLTGSIGVLGGKIVLEGLWDKLGVHWGSLNYGKNAGILSMNHKFSPSEKAVFNRSLDRIYADFTAKVSTARHIDPEKMDELARGRVWLGKNAVDNGLVDQLGGFEQALSEAKKRAQIAPDTEFGLVYYPRRQSFQEKLTKFFENGGGLPAMKVLEQTGLDSTDVQILYRLRHDAVLPPLKINF